MIPVGLAVQPDEEFLDLLGEEIARADYCEVAPETLWRLDGGGGLSPNGFHRRFAALATRGKAFVAHGVGLSPSGGGPGEAERRRVWLRRIAADHETFRFGWYTDHLGLSAPAGQAATLPLPPWPTQAAVATTGRLLAALQQIVPDVGVENSVFYFQLGLPWDEARLLREISRPQGRHVLLDLHNLHTQALNLGFDPLRYLAELDLGKVIEIHLSGGTQSEAGWLPGGRTLRLDSHDDAVPEAVWALLAQVAPRCPHLRGVTLERMEGTVGQADVPLLAEELRRARRVLAAPGPCAPLPARRQTLWPLGDADGQRRYEEVLLAVLRARDPGQALVDAAADPALPAALREALAAADADGVRLSALLVARLRFERLLRGSPDAESWFDRDPGGFSAAFRRYHEAVPPAAFFPPGEAALFAAFCAESPA